MGFDSKSLIVLGISTVAVVVPFLLLGDYFDHWSVSWLGASERLWSLVLIGVVLLAADALLPIPSSVVSALLVASLGPWWGAGAIWVGMLLGSFVGYAAGVAGRLALPTALLSDAGALMRRVGVLSVFATKGVPVLGEAMALTAGAMRVPLHSFAAASALASLILAALYAGTAALIPASLGQVSAMFFAALLVPAVALATFKRFFGAAGS